MRRRLVQAFMKEFMKREDSLIKEVPEVIIHGRC